MERRVKAVFDKYANFITASPETTADVEMLCKYLSYFVSGELRCIPATFPFAARFMNILSYLFAIKAN